MSVAADTPYGFASHPDDIETEPKVVGGDVTPLHAVVRVDDPATETVFHWDADRCRDRASRIEEHTPSFDSFATTLRQAARRAEELQEGLA